MTKPLCVLLLLLFAVSPVYGFDVKIKAGQTIDEQFTELYESKTTWTLEKMLYDKHELRELTCNFLIGEGVDCTKTMENEYIINFAPNADFMVARLPRTMRYMESAAILAGEREEFVKKLMRDLDRLEVQLGSKNVQLKKAISKVRNLEQALQEAKAENEKLVEENGLLTTANSNLLSSLVKEKETTATLTTEIEGLNTKVLEQKSLISDLKTMVDDRNQWIMWLALAIFFAFVLPVVYYQWRKSTTIKKAITPEKKKSADVCSLKKVPPTVTLTEADEAA